MQLKKAQQTEAEAMSDRVIAAMETGNHAQARTLLRELKAIDTSAYEKVRADIIGAYGVGM